MEVVAKCGAKLNRHGVSDCLGRIVTLHIVSYILYTSSIQILWWCGLFFNVFWIFIVFRVLLYMWKNRGHCLPMCITFELIYIRFLGTLASTTRLIFIQCLITIYILYRIYIYVRCSTSSCLALEVSSLLSWIRNEKHIQQLDRIKLPTLVKLKSQDPST